MKKYFLISSKANDFNASNMAVIFEKESFIKRHVYYYKEISKEDYDVLKRHLEDVNESDFEDFGYNLAEYLEEYF